uniref:NADH-ubiquinone oxidoreductase chain 3 n=1 Tax=Paraleius leontonychus TaxID=1807943 RepID=A0A330JG63_9ACAR|nr:NADH dehydrogenase subunit 3 [Paraleius leontonychus]
MKISILWVTALMLLTVFFIAFAMVKKEGNLTKNNNSQFECGFTIMNPSQLPFSFQFFLVALLFLIFDVEIALILSYPMEPKTTKNLIVISSFLAILAVGLIYEWQKSKIDWSK